MADFVKTQGHVRLFQAAESFKALAHQLSGVLRRLAGTRASGIEMMQNFSAYKGHYQVKADPWLLLDRTEAWERSTW
jgi:hypothetical protein